MQPFVEELYSNQGTSQVTFLRRFWFDFILPINARTTPWYQCKSVCTIGICEHFYSNNTKKMPFYFPLPLQFRNPPICLPCFYSLTGTKFIGFTFCTPNFGWLPQATSRVLQMSIISFYLPHISCTMRVAAIFMVVVKPRKRSISYVSPASFIS